MEKDGWGSGGGGVGGWQSHLEEHPWGGNGVCPSFMPSCLSLQRCQAGDVGPGVRLFQVWRNSNRQCRRVIPKATILGRLMQVEHME
jgi:hypothetical protein